MYRFLVKILIFWTTAVFATLSWLKEISKIKPKIQSFKKFLIGQFKLVLIFWQALFTANSVAVMLVTSLCWWLYDGDIFEMLVAKSLCWRFSQCIKSVSNNSELSPTHLVSNIRHQHPCNLKLITGKPYRETENLVDFSIQTP